MLTGSALNIDPREFYTRLYGALLNLDASKSYSYTHHTGKSPGHISEICKKDKGHSFCVLIATHELLNWGCGLQCHVIASYSIVVVRSE